LFFENGIKTMMLLLKIHFLQKKRHFLVEVSAIIWKIKRYA
jgi:hypothetical protein